MAYFLGVDGGATSTASAVCDDNGRVLGVGHGGPSNHILAPGGEARARSALETALGAAEAAAGLHRVECAYWPVLHTLHVWACKENPDGAGRAEE